MEKQSITRHKIQWRRIILLVPLLLPTLCRICVAADFTAPNVDRRTVSIDGINFTIPDGTQLQKVADQPFVRWPIAADWDTDGSLIVLESNWNRQSVQQQLESKPQRIVRLRDSDGDGLYDKRTVIVEKLSFSAGVLVYGDALFVSSPPAILKLTDPDGDGLFDARETWYDGGTLTHCANDLHGPVLGPDGWIYWTKGAFAKQEYKTLLGKRVTSSAAHLLRRHPAGGPIDILMSGGMDNPVDVTFLPNGERIFCSTFMHHPGDGLRDGLGHAIYGSLFGKPHAPIDGHLRTGPLFDPIAELGPAAPAAVMTVSPNTLTHNLKFFPESTDAHQTLISSQFNLQRLGIHRLIPAGGTFTTLSQDLISADRVDFHPVDCLEEPDGSLLILDTGGWYDLCCPSSGTPGQIAPGGIYRLSLLASAQPSASQASDPTVNKVQPNQLSQVWTTALELVEQPNNLAARDRIIDFLNSPDESVRQAALNVVSLYRWDTARSSLIDILRSPPSSEATHPSFKHTGRLAAECLGRMGNPSQGTIETLIGALEKQQPDRTADHAILYALIELDARPELHQALASDSPRRQWAALICLSQLKAFTSVDARRLFELAASPNEFVRTQAIQTIASQPQLADAAAEQLDALWKTDASSAFELLHAVATNWRGQPVIERFVARALLTWESLSDNQKEWVRFALRGQRGSPLPPNWREPLLGILSGTVDQAIEMAFALNGLAWDLEADEPILVGIVKLADDPDLDLETKLALLRLLPDRAVAVPEELVDQVVRGVTDDDSNLADRCAAVLVKVPLADHQTERLVQSLENLSPPRLQKVVLAILAVNEPFLDQKLVAKIPQIPLARSLSIGSIEAAVSNRPGPLRKAFTEALQEVQSPTENIEAEVNRYLAKLPPGDAVEGYQVFRSSKASCAGCHRVGYVGGGIGPELTRIGRSRSRYDLAEAILFPSARLEQSYRSTRVLTVDGRVYNGLLADLSSTHLELITGVEQTEIIPFNAIERREPSPISVMPSGLETVLTPQQFADLLAFLQAAR